MYGRNRRNWLENSWLNKLKDRNAKKSGNQWKRATKTQVMPHMHALLFRDLRAAFKLLIAQRFYLTRRWTLQNDWWRNEGAKNIASQLDRGLFLSWRTYWWLRVWRSCWLGQNRSDLTWKLIFDWRQWIITQIFKSLNQSCLLIMCCFTLSKRL